jgi:hypothetical protein
MVSQAFQETPIHRFVLSELPIGIRAVGIMHWFLSVLRVVIILHTLQSTDIKSNGQCSQVVDAPLKKSGQVRVMASG